MGDSDHRRDEDESRGVRDRSRSPERGGGGGGDSYRFIHVGSVYMCCTALLELLYRSVSQAQRFGEGERRAPRAPREPLRCSAPPESFERAHNRPALPHFQKIARTKGRARLRLRRRVGRRRRLCPRAPACATPPPRATGALLRLLDPGHLPARRTRRLSVRHSSRTHALPSLVARLRCAARRCGSTTCTIRTPKRSLALMGALSMGSHGDA